MENAARHWQQKEVLRILHEADRQAGGTSTHENCNGGGGALCGVALEELAHNSPEQLETIFQGAVAARTERLLGRATSLPLVLSCSDRALGRERSSGGEHLSFVTGAGEVHCHRLQEAAVTLGCDVDWSRTLRTDDEDLLYRSFVEWQVLRNPSPYQGASLEPGKSD